MNRSQYLLTVASEECNEVAQRCSKAIRFGLDEIQQGQELTNAERIIYEFNDLIAVMEMLYEEGLLHKLRDQEAIQRKKIKVDEWFLHARSQKTVVGLTTQENEIMKDFFRIKNDILEDLEYDEEYFIKISKIAHSIHGCDEIVNRSLTTINSVRNKSFTI